LSRAHRGDADKSQAQLTAISGEGDTPSLLSKKYNLDTSHGVAYGGGISVRGDTVYIDQRLYREIMAGGVNLPGVDPQIVVDETATHEHSEWAIIVGDNPVDNYGGAHAFAEAAGHRVVTDHHVDPERYEKAYRPLLDRCAARDPVHAPKDLWCGPYHDVAFTDIGVEGRRAKQILRIYRQQGVEDAFKVSKGEMHYGIGEYECRKCRHYGGGKMNTCAIVSGLVRADRQCDSYEEK
jgi:hypothetical protein